MNIVTRLSELATRALDVTLTSDDRENYSKEAKELVTQYLSLFKENLNGVALFDVKDGCGSQTISQNFSQSGTHEEKVFEVDTINGSGVAKIDQFRPVYTRSISGLSWRCAYSRTSYWFLIDVHFCGGYKYW